MVAVVLCEPVVEDDAWTTVPTAVVVAAVLGLPVSLSAVEEAALNLVLDPTLVVLALPFATAARLRTCVALLFWLGSEKRSKLAQLSPPFLSEAHSLHRALLAQMLSPSLTTLPPALVHDVRSWVIMVARLPKKSLLPDPMQSRHLERYPYQASSSELGMQMQFVISDPMPPGRLIFWHLTMAV